jgi:putative ABC transport system permease protein
MGPLQKKLVRDLWRLRWQVAAIALLIACGVSVAVMAFSAQEALRAAQERYYEETRFADVFATLNRAPLSIAPRLGEIEGVTAVDVRIVKAGLMDVPGLLRPAVARMVSLPQGPGALNLIVLKAGRLPDPGRPDEAVALKTFMDAAKVKLGDRLAVTIVGKRMEFTVVGEALSPEYVYVPSPESTMPDDAHQAVFWMNRQALEKAANLGGAFNTVALRLAHGVREAAVLREVDRILAPYGGLRPYGREDQPSNAFVEAELKELQTSASILPPIFLIVAATLVNIVVGRLVDSEREHIGLLKAFGYSDLEAASLYLGLAAAVGLIGAAAGGLLGAELGSAITRLYEDYMRFPVLEPRFHLVAFLGAGLAAIAAALLGSFGAVWRAARLSPAVAMQPQRPAAYRRGWPDRLASALDQPSRMILRNLERYPVRAGITIVGLAASLTLLVGTQFIFDSLDRIIEHAYYRERHASDYVGFGEIRDARAVSEVRRMPGVIAAEPVRFAPAVIASGGREERLGLTGLDADSRLSAPLSRTGARIPFEGRGVILSEALARRLRVVPGEKVTVEIDEGRRPVLQLPVTAVAEDYSGLAAYVDRRELNRMLAEGDNASTAQLLVASDQRKRFYAAVSAAPMVVGASSRDDTVANWRVVMTGAFRTNLMFYVSFAGAIAFGVAYNMSRVSLQERGRDLATLHVLGFGHGECAYILIGEIAVLALLAIPLGVLGGNGLARGLIALYSRQDLRLPATISLQSYGVAITAFLGAVALASGLTARRIWTLDLVAVLKTRE